MKRLGIIIISMLAMTCNDVSDHNMLVTSCSKCLDPIMASLCMESTREVGWTSKPNKIDQAEYFSKQCIQIEQNFKTKYECK